MLPFSKSSSLNALVNATVRVNNGAGFLLDRGPGQHRVIVTASHVVEALPADVKIIWENKHGSSHELVADKDADISIVSVTDDMRMSGLRLVEPGEPVCLGDEVWSAGFPQGWNGSDPIISRGVVAGVVGEGKPAPWINIDGTWGCSGGPIVILTPDGPRVIGIVLGEAGVADKEIQTALNDKDFMAYLEQKRAETKAANADRNLLVLNEILVILGNMIKFFSRRISEHFRTGHVRIATAEQIRAQLC